MGEPKGYLIVPVGFRADGTLRTLELTDSDELKVALTTATGSDLLTELQAKLETADLELVSKILSIGSHGWLGGAWQRNPFILGYSDIKTEAFSGTSTGEASTNGASTVVPAGELHSVNFSSCYHNDTVNRSITATAYDGSASFEYASWADVPPYTVKVSTTPFVLKPGTLLLFTCWALADTKIIYGRYWSSRIDIDQ